MSTPRVVSCLEGDMVDGGTEEDIEDDPGADPGTALDFECPDEVLYRSIGRTNVKARGKWLGTNSSFSLV